MTDPSNSLSTAPKLSRFEKPPLVGWLILVAVLTFVIGSFRTVEIAPDRVARGFSRVLQIGREMIPPRVDRIVPLIQQTLITLQIAMLGTLIGIGLSLVAGKYACRHLASRWMATAIRSFVAVVRTVPELIWGLLFVACFGLGPFAGVLAVAADTFGFCGRFFTEAFDDVEDRDLEGLRGLGASPFGQFLALIVPQSLPNLIHTSLYALERAVRASIVLGLVGAGGIGVELDVAMRLFRYDEASTIMLLILVLVLLIERISELVRRRIRPYSQAS